MAEDCVVFAPALTVRQQRTSPGSACEWKAVRTETPPIGIVDDDLEPRAVARAPPERPAQTECPLQLPGEGPLTPAAGAFNCSGPGRSATDPRKQRAPVIQWCVEDGVPSTAHPALGKLAWSLLRGEITRDGVSEGAPARKRTWSAPRNGSASRRRPTCSPRFPMKFPRTALLFAKSRYGGAIWGIRQVFPPPRNRLSFFADPAESPAARDGTSCRIRRRTQQEGELNNDARTQTGPTDPKNRQECHVANGRKTEHLRKTKAEEMPQKPESAGGRKSPGVQNENA